VIYKPWVPHVQRFLGSAAARKFVAAGSFIPTHTLDPAQLEPFWQQSALPHNSENTEIGLLVEHEQVAFPSFPQEWPPEMLYSAGRLTIDLALALLEEGMGLKDATPYNVLFRGPNGVFVDLLSIEQRDPHDATWLPFAQFERTILLPLLASREFHVPLDQIFLTHRDGLEPGELYARAGPLQKLIPPVLTLCSIPTWLRGRADAKGNSLYREKRVGDPAKAKFILESLLKNLRGKLENLKPGTAKGSHWSDYMASSPSYTPEGFAAKETFVRESLAQFPPRSVLDIGSNNGHFSSIAARAGASVVSIDSDPRLMGELWRSSRAQKLDILPLVVNISRPTPAIGWRNQENPSFLERASGAFDVVFLLAVIHHLLVTDGVPLPSILEAASELTRGIVVAEFVGPNDPMFRRILHGRENLYEGLNTRTFEACCQPYFHIVRSIRVGESDRWLYLLEKKSNG
jgi:SAM-dependent methyltransferase